MANAFLQVGDHYVNMDLVSRVELVRDRRRTGEIKAVRLYPAVALSGPLTYKDPADVGAVVKWLGEARPG